MSTLIQWGTEKLWNTPFGIDINVPKKLLPFNTINSNQVLYTNGDGGISLQLVKHQASEMSFQELYSMYVRSSDGQHPAYQMLADDHFVVSGRSTGKFFYAFYDLDADGNAVGFVVSSTDRYESVATTLAVYEASRFFLLDPPVRTAALSPAAPTVSQAVRPVAPISPAAAAGGQAAIDSSPSSALPNRTEVSLEDTGGGTFLVPVVINGAISLDFLIDSGASDVSIPADVFSTLARTGTIEDADILTPQTYTLADGSTTSSPTFRIRSLKVGDRVLQNVIASVSDAKGSLLLGQSFLRNFKSWSIDNGRKVLVLVPN
jgi:clan AA aspartic protease (TIGR02281 family)